MKIKFAKKFVKQYEKADQKVKDAAKKKLELFRNNPSHPQLKNHPLTGRLADYRSINITGDWRALYSEYKDNEGNIVIVFEVIGTHSQLYG